MFDFVLRLDSGMKLDEGPFDIRFKFHGALVGAHSSRLWGYVDVGRNFWQPNLVEAGRP